MNRGLLLAPLLLVLVGCGGGSDDALDRSTPTPAIQSPSESASTATSVSPEAELEDAYRTYIKAFLTGDGATAYALLSERCQASKPLSEFAAISESAANLYGEVDYTINDVTVDGNKGSLDATYAVDALNSGGGSEWIYEDGGWRSDKCD